MANRRARKYGRRIEDKESIAYGKKVANAVGREIPDKNSISYGKKPANAVAKKPIPLTAKDIAGAKKVLKKKKKKDVRDMTIDEYEKYLNNQ